MQVILVPTAGLCNRINAMLSAIAANRTYHIPISIFWEKTSDCCAEYSELFEPLEISGISVSALHKFQLKPGGRKCLFLPNLIRKFTFDASYNGDKVHNNSLLELCRDKHKIYIYSYNRFCLSEITEEPISDFFTPIKSIRSQIESTVKMFQPNTIGLHIRQTDNAMAIRNNPISKFTSYMDAEIKNDPACKFYLATDSPELKRYLIEKYPNRIIYSNNELARNTTRGMQDAVAELFCLGRTQKIIGCTNSTYSLVAARLYNIPLIL